MHPQHWPEDLEYEGKRVVVIGSGATAVTLVPAMAPDTEHITMLQRSPSYVLALPGHDPVADLLRKVLPKKAAYAAIRWKNVMLTIGTYQLSRRRAEVRAGGCYASSRSWQLPKGYDVDTHFNPRYDPWDQRMCIVPGGDLFKSIKRGDASVVTDQIETFTEKGIQLASGDELEADIIVTATGLNVQALGGVEVKVDGRGFEPSQTVGYKGIMFSGIPNLALAIGYTNASWTLKCDLACEYVCRLLAPHGRAWLLAGHAGLARGRAPRPGRSSISSRATCCAPSTSSPSRATTLRGGSTRTTCATCRCSSARRSRTARWSSGARPALRLPSQSRRIAA